MRSVFILNSGSSSVKASLLLLTDDDDKSGEETCLQQTSVDNVYPMKPPIRLVTALAERLNTSDSVLHLTISVSAAKVALSHYHPHEEISNKKKNLLRSNSLQLTSRSTVEHHHSALLEDDPTIIVESEKKNVKIDEGMLTHKRSVELILEELNTFDTRLLSSVIAVGHRVVHGGPTFYSSVVITEEVLSAIQDVSHLAPLHNPANLVGIQIAQQVFPSHIPNVAVFDTAFHSTMPPYAYTYPIPKEYRNDHAIRKYGFHGTSVQYVSRMGETIVRSSKSTFNNPIKLIVAHLGNGASVTAVVDGKSMDTSMEFTPLSGIMMGTRSGSIDPSIVSFASKFMKKTPDEVLNDLNKKSGLMGIGGNNDMRSILASASKGDEQAALAAEMFVYILAKYIASLLVACGGTIDALIFTAGIGENSAYIRRETVSKLSPLLGNVMLDDDNNDSNGKKSGGVISQAQLDTDPVVKPFVLVIPTDEEAMICLECERLVYDIN